ncbi:MAG: CoB--CoM heterodisulfide reductase iron-sulfur subunit B family protein [Deltaproteobacteria bacterium]|nr:CoB--CoM heterodisulfide reductase iron-sulfur subunit B family protein [Deltaproteobacteria bacterium]
MKYLYYPGCSLEGTALEYNASTQAFMRKLEVELWELEDWICCGASAAEATSRLLSLVLPAYNLAIAEETDGNKEILVPCSACYLNLKKVEEKSRKDPELLGRINTILKEKDLHFHGRVRVRHLLDVIANDVGPEKIVSRVKNPLVNLNIAPYYGCQCLRPYSVFDDPEEPRSMEPLIEAVGAKIHPWNMGGRCCGASQMNTHPEVALELIAAILKAARGADAIVTVCPMCQMNLEAYQKKISGKSKEDMCMTILYLPQFLGLAMGLSEQDLRLDLNLSITKVFRDKL